MGTNSTARLQNGLKSGWREINKNKWCKKAGNSRDKGYLVSSRTPVGTDQENKEMLREKTQADLSWAANTETLNYCGRMATSPTCSRLLPLFSPPFICTNNVLKATFLTGLQREPYAELQISQVGLFQVEGKIQKFIDSVGNIKWI